MSDDPAPVTVVVIGRNEGERLGRCLASVRRADYPAERVELIYVDTDSIDNSREVAEAWGAKVLHIKPRRPSAAAARNAGWSAASNELVQFLDGDTILNSAWLSIAVKIMDDPTCACVFGRTHEIDATSTVYRFWAHHDWHVAPGVAEASGGNALFRRSVLKRARGFDESLVAGEEQDVCFRIRRDQELTVLCVDHSMVIHDIGMTRFAQYWHRCKRTGYAYAEVGGRYRELRSWRLARWRNLGHVLAIPAVLILSAVLWSLWPMVLWAGLLSVALVRNALRLRERTGTFYAALLCSVHHYICKLPMTLGQCAYWRRRLLRLPPEPLIEYREGAQGRGLRASES